MSRRYKFPTLGTNTIFSVLKEPREERIVYWIWNHHYHQLSISDIAGTVLAIALWGIIVLMAVIILES